MEYKYIYGPVPSRRMGLSLGVSPIPPKYCNYSCIYCQLGRTAHLTNKRENYFEVNLILSEFKEYISKSDDFDVVTIVGEGEPTLYTGIGELISGLKLLTDRPIAIITNGALLESSDVRAELLKADIVLPSFDAYDEATFKKINRSIGSIRFEKVFEGLKEFSKEFKGQLWLELMLVKDINDSTESIMMFKELLESIEYDKLYINTPVRPPAENNVSEPTIESIQKASSLLNGISINKLVSEGFYSNITDDYDALKSILRRHPMNQFEIKTFLGSRNCNTVDELFESLMVDDEMEFIDYKGYLTYRFRV